MKLHLSLLKKFVDIPLKETSQIVELLDDLGLEVKGYQDTDGGDVLFTLELLANRGDHHCVLGMAREIASRNLASVSQPAISSLECSRSLSMPLRINTDKCSQYIALEIELPETLKVRSEVESYSMSLKHPLVDTLNYVQYEFGQPLHAFDRDLLVGELRVEELREATEVVALDDQAYQVPAGSIVICDAKKIVAVAGVIGCKNSCVTQTTRRSVLESASFDPVAVRKTARAMGLSTDASKIFERGSDPETPVIALRRVIYLLAGAGGATSSGGCRVIGMARHQGKAYEPLMLQVSLSQIQDAVNSPRLSEMEIIRRLAILGFQVDFLKKEKKFQIGVPSWRKWDIFHPEDIVEEFVRSYGLGRIKRKPFPLEVQPVPAEPTLALLRDLSPILRSNGFSEVITKAFYSEQYVAALADFGVLPASHVRILNAIEKSNSALRYTMLPHLLEVVHQNQTVGEGSVKIYEASRVFERADDGKSREHFRLGFCWFGSWHQRLKPEDLDTESRALLFKGVAESVLQEIGLSAQIEPGAVGVLHPGIQVKFVKKRKMVGFVGMVHPEFSARMRVRGDVFYGEFDVNLLQELREHHLYTEPSKFPAVRRDVTVKLNDQYPAGKLLQKLEGLKLPFCQDICIYDWFRKEGEAETRVTYRFLFREENRTLEGDEVDLIMESARLHVSDVLKLELA
jgi:phenylalanyl-tRNA synthetase beta chain